MEYTGFWKRFCAYWIDVIISLPIMFLSLWGCEQSRLFQLYWLLPGLVIGLGFHVYLVRTYGGTPGKLLLNIKIAKVDGTDVGYKEAVLRYAVLFICSLVMSIALVIVALDMTDAQYFSMTWLKRQAYMVEHTPVWYNVANITMSIWIWSEFIVMLTNKKRRALHDFVAGTVVVRNSQVTDN
ncbi:RDD family protein [Agarivorans aestuarii]|uniref:RDD family protein n=1 Tax=Agarivorans aestuarii TaxID=1563703 RepID=UPI001C805D1F|nr:RDD family protein [Agarivorans aestuarii]